MYSTFLGCGGTLFKNKGTFTSEYYPLPYIREQRDCTWVITANNTKHSSNASRSLTLSFEDFHVGQADKVSRSCDADYVEIREGKGFLSPFKVRLCGDKKPDPIITLQESLYVRLHSTAIPPVGLDNEFRRFKASFKTDCK